jgi:hypothetical protein
MTYVDLLSDTTYRQQAVGQLDSLLGNSTQFPVETSQIYGLRQIARQQPSKVNNFAEHQMERAQRKLERASRTAQQKLQSEIDFWTLVDNLGNNESSDWSVLKEGHSHLPEDIREENIPPKKECKTTEQRKERDVLRKRQKDWLEQWVNEHIPAFFERFCTHCLYCKAMMEMDQSRDENNVEAQPEENGAEGNSAIREAIIGAGLRD